jgi:hypothetical protein
VAAGIQRSGIVFCGFSRLHVLRQKRYRFAEFTLDRLPVRMAMQFPVFGFGPWDFRAAHRIITGVGT